VPQKVIGLIGGLSWESSAEYYRIINEQVRDRLGGLRSARCLIRQGGPVWTIEASHSATGDPPDRQYLAGRHYIANAHKISSLYSNAQALPFI